MKAILIIMGVVVGVLILLFIGFVSLLQKRMDYLSNGDESDETTEDANSCVPVKM